MEIKGIGALVTGGGSGLGEATARELARRGASVALLDLAGSKGPDNAAGIEKDGGKAVFLEADVTSEEQVEAAVSQIYARFPALRMVVNCAGIAPAARTVGKGNAPFDYGLFKKTVEVNLIGSFNVIRLAAARMVENDPAGPDGERGVIVNTASIAAYEGQVGQAAYSASKGGVVGMTLPIARDLARHGIRVATIAPGLFLTPMLQGLPEKTQESLGASVPFPSRLGSPIEYAALACHIAENPMINGEVIRLDGAIRMAPQ